MGKNSSKDLRKKIKDLHDVASILVWMREDVDKPLTNLETIEFTDLNNKCEELQNELKMLKHLELIEERKAKALKKLGAEERILLITLGNSTRGCDIYDLILRSKLNRSVIKEHLDIFLENGWIKRKTGRRYKLSTEMQECYKQYAI